MEIERETSFTSYTPWWVRVDRSTVHWCKNSASLWLLFELHVILLYLSKNIRRKRGKEVDSMDLLKSSCLDGFDQLKKTVGSVCDFCCRCEMHKWHCNQNFNINQYSCHSLSLILTNVLHHYRWLRVWLVRNKGDGVYWWRNFNYPASLELNFIFINNEISRTSMSFVEI